MSDKSRKAREQVEQMIAKKVAKKQQPSSVDKTTIEYAVYEFIQKLEELSILTNSGGHSVMAATGMINMVHKDLSRKIKSFDPLAGFDVEYSQHEVEGVRWPKLEKVIIKWSQSFAEENKLDQNMSISVAEIMIRYLF